MQTLGNLKVCEGLSKKQALELVKYTNTDPLILEHTQDTNRFKDFDTYKEWLKKNRNLYALTDKTDKLMGIIWFGKKRMPKGNHYSQSINTNHYSITFAIRLYEHARGKGLAKKFIKAAWQIYINSDEYLNNHANGLWLETNINNFAAVKAYKRVGFVLVSKPDLNGQVLMIQK